MPKAYRDNQEQLLRKIKEQYQGPPLKGPLRVELELHGEGRADIDNVVGAFFDTANKVLWEDDRHPSEAERVVYSAKRTYGRDGMRMLLAAGVAMRAFDDDDWAFLVSLCDGAVRDAYARRGAAPPFTAAHVEARRRMDAYNAAFLRKLQAEIVASSDK